MHCVLSSNFTSTAQFIHTLWIRFNIDILCEYQIYIFFAILVSKEEKKTFTVHNVCVFVFASKTIVVYKSIVQNKE